MARAHAEMDRVLGGDRTRMPTYAEANRFTFVRPDASKRPCGCGRPRRPSRSASNEPTVLAGKYRLEQDVTCTVLIPMLHRDPAVWGEDVAVFDPDRFTAEREAALPPNAYKPFGNGVRPASAGSLRCRKPPWRWA